MIHLLGITKVYVGKGQQAKLVFQPTTVSLPTDRRVAILGGRLQGKSVLMRLMTGQEMVDSGEVIAATRFSPVANSGGVLDAQLSGRDNIRFLSRVFGLEPERLTAAVLTFCGKDDFLDAPLRALGASERRALEVALTVIPPFDCYVVDHVSSLGADILERCLDAAAQRHAGIIYATTKSREVRRYADFVAVIAHQTVYPFSNIDEAILFYERYEREEA